MSRTKYTIRGTLLVLIVLLMTTKKTEDSFARIAKFKLNTANKIQSDSLAAKQKLDVLVNETTAFNKDFFNKSPKIRDGLRYL